MNTTEETTHRSDVCLMRHTNVNFWTRWQLVSGERDAYYDHRPTREDINNFAATEITLSAAMLIFVSNETRRIEGDEIQVWNGLGGTGYIAGNDNITVVIDITPTGVHVEAHNHKIGDIVGQWHLS